MSDFSAYSYLSTTGAGVAVGGTGAIHLLGAVRGSDLAGTLTIKNGTTTLLTMSADRALTFDPIALSGPVTMTSSAGSHFILIYRAL